MPGKILFCQFIFLIFIAKIETRALSTFYLQALYFKIQKWIISIKCQWRALGSTLIWAMLFNVLCVFRNVLSAKRNAIKLGSFYLQRLAATPFLGFAAQRTNFRLDVLFTRG